MRIFIFIKIQWNLLGFRLTLGLMGLDELHLRVLATSSDDPKEKKNAQKGKRIKDDVSLITISDMNSSSQDDAKGPSLDSGRTSLIFPSYLARLLMLRLGSPSGKCRTSN